MIIKTTPENYQDTLLYKLLCEKSKPTDGLTEKTTTFITTVKPLQELIIAGPFKDYTLHNPNHSKKLMHLAEYIIPSETINSLSALDITIMIMSFYLHDLGMVLTQTERERIINSNEFQEHLQIKTEYGSKLNNIRKLLTTDSNDLQRPSLELAIFQITEAALSDYIRPQHATNERYTQLIQVIKESSGRADLFNISGVSFEHELIDICISHNLNSSALAETKGIHNEKFKRELIINGFSLNMQYCAAILRLVDILDFDKERTPVSLFNALGIQNKALPGFEISLLEWNKHISIHTISIDSDEIVISGDSKHPTIEHAIREFCKIIEAEIKETQTILKHNKADILEKYKLNLPLIVRPNIRSINYTYKEYSLKLDETAIINLLMGENLYANSYASIREILQNSIDACNLRAKIANTDYFPKIQVSTVKDSDQRTWLVVKDNGIGMDEYVLTNFFFKIGNSYYSSPEFKRISINRQITNFVPISRFGIGLISVFMIGEQIKITTKNNYSFREDKKERVLLIDSVNSLAVVTESEHGLHGTTIEILLRRDKDNENFINKLFQYVRETIIRPNVPIEIADPNQVVLISNNNYIHLKSKIKPQLADASIEVIQLDLERFSNILKGKAIFFFFKNTDETLSYYDKNLKYVWGKDPLKSTMLFENFHGGSRVTVNGIKMGLKRIGSLYNTSKASCSAVFDIEISGIPEVVYTISRQKIYGDGLNNIKKEIFNSIEKGFREIGIYSTFDVETKKMLQSVLDKRLSTEKISEELIDQISSLLPQSTPYPENIHIEIAQKLGISNSKAYKYVKSIIYRKR